MKRVFVRIQRVEPGETPQDIWVFILDVVLKSGDTQYLGMFNNGAVDIIHPDEIRAIDATSYVDASGVVHAFDPGYVSRRFNELTDLEYRLWHEL